MDRIEARTMLAETLAKFRELSYSQLVVHIRRMAPVEVIGPSGTKYQIEIQFMWDNTKDGDVRVMAGIDDGWLAARSARM